jgi:hypothetical protein
VARRDGFATELFGVEPSRTGFRQRYQSLPGAEFSAAVRKKSASCSACYYALIGGFFNRLLGVYNPP